MSSKLKFFTACVLCLLMAACSGRPIYAPVGSRSNPVDPPATIRTASDRSEVVGNPAASKATEHIVRRGETVFSIAGRYDISFRQLAKNNGIRFPYIIRVGQRLRLKAEATAESTPVVVSAPVAEVSKPKPLKPAPKIVQKKIDPPAPPEAETVISFDGKWQWPTRGRLLRGFRANEPGKKGIYIGGHSGQPVKAAASGKVVYVGSGLVGYGRLIIIRHTEDLLSTYGHNSELLVAEGEYVKTGQMIAKMGSSSVGRNELYFEIRKEGKPVDPSAYLPKQP